ncbi:MAG: hypothetical protein ACKOX6_15885 [Bdellovibrio sp.]
MATAKEMIQDAKMKAEVEVQNFAQMEAQLDIDLKAAEDAGYDMAKSELQIPDTAKIYTEADLQAEKKILQDQIDALNADKAAAAQAQVDAVAAAVSAREQEIAAQIESVEVDNLELVKKLKGSSTVEANA